MIRYLEIRRSFEPEYRRAGVGGFLRWDTNFYYLATRARNRHRQPRTMIPRNLQARLRNPARVIANGYEFNDRWVKRWKRLLCHRTQSY